MAAQKGKDLLLKLDDGNGVFVSVLGLRSRQLSFNAEPVDVSSAESVGRWRELLAGAGMRRAGLNGSGVFRDEASDLQVRQVFFEGTIRTWQVVIPSFGLIQGPFHVTSLDYRGDHAGEITFDIGLDSAGPLTFTAL